MTALCSTMRNARALLYHRCGGLLSLHSASLAGFPEATAIPYCLDAQGRPVFLLHGAEDQPAAGDRRVSLTLVDGCTHAGRLTLLGTAERVGERDALAAARFRRYFPPANTGGLPLDATYWSLCPTHARYTDAMGQTRWLDPEDLLLINPVHPDDERDFVRHMNTCHTAAMRGYCARADVLVPRGMEPAMAGIDALGFHLRIGPRLVRFDFRHPVTAVQEVRSELLAMAREPLSPSLH